MTVPLRSIFLTIAFSVQKVPFSRIRIVSLPEGWLWLWPLLVLLVIFGSTRRTSVHPKCVELGCIKFLYLLGFVILLLDIFFFFHLEGCLNTFLPDFPLVLDPNMGETAPTRLQQSTPHPSITIFNWSNTYWSLGRLRIFYRSEIIYGYVRIWWIKDGAIIHITKP